ncbi:MAG: glycosyltransferase family 2 protein [Candidatus Omnitrophica bacterium]|nr:glycosyltransferase family 2 protein [Candidatus Omnitrophota bacterium]
MFLSVVIPAYNEEKRLQSTLEKIYSYLKNKNFEYEIIAIDDGSADLTAMVALESRLAKENKLNLLKNEKNTGKGFSVRKGILASTGDYILFTDSDLSTPIEEFDELLLHVQAGYDIAIGSRSVEGADVRVHQPFYREIMGRAFNFFVQLFVLKGLADTQCGFKLFKAKAAKDIAKELKIDRFGFDVEMLYLAKKKNYKIKEVPVIWLDSPVSKINPILDSWRMFIDLLTIKRLHG